MLEKIEYLIHKAIISKDQSDLIHQIQAGNINQYAVKYESFFAGVSHRGLREDQEDRVDFDELPGFESLSRAQQNYVINKTVFEMQQELHDHKSGSCLLTNIVSPLYDQQQKVTGYHVVTINLGDSESILATLKGQTTTLEELNTSHRLPENSFIEDVHRKKNINIERTFGDKYFPKLIRTADITHKIVKLNGDEKLYLLLFSDGVRECSQLNNEINNVIGYYSYSTNIIADKITQAAWQSGSSDNISVLAMNLNTNIEKPYTLSVYDGHGGDATAKYLAQNFIKQLAKNVNAELTLADIPEILPRDTIIKKNRKCNSTHPIVKCLQFFGCKPKYHKSGKNPPFTHKVSQKR